jgi:hypothetical protein
VGVFYPYFFQFSKKKRPLAANSAKKQKKPVAATGLQG